MNLKKDIINQQISELQQYANNSGIPNWDNLPDIELYMDQVIYLLNQYLEKDINSPITQSMINNYVKLKTIPAPIKKRYSKTHMAYLIIVCTLKQILSISTIQKIVPVDMEQEEIKNLYSSFITNRQKSMEYALNLTKIISDNNGCKNTENDIIMQFSNTAEIFKMLTEAIIINNKEKSEVKK